MEGDKELFEMVNSNHRRNGMTQHVGYIVYDDQAARLMSLIDSQAKKNDPMPLVVIALQVIVCAAVIIAIIV